MGKRSTSLAGSTTILPPDGAFRSQFHCSRFRQLHYQSRAVRSVARRVVNGFPEGSASFGDTVVILGLLENKLYREMKRMMSYEGATYSGFGPPPNQPI